LSINGDLKLDLGWISRVSANQIQFENAGWSKHPQMAEIGNFEAQIDLWQLLTKFRLVLPAVTISQPKIVLEKNARGSANWSDNDNNGNNAIVALTPSQFDEMGAAVRPGFAAIQAAGQHMLGGAIVIDGVALCLVLEESRFESYQNFITPRPDAMIRRPAAETARLCKDFEMLLVSRDRRLGCDRGRFAEVADCKDYEPPQYPPRQRLAGNCITVRHVQVTSAVDRRH
jgi:hypothetical protein